MLRSLSLSTMFYKSLLLILIICACLTLAEINQKQNDLKEQKGLNDSILEFFHSCVCIPYPRCPHTNNYMFAARANFIPKKILCSDPDYVCCKEITIETTTNKPSVPSTTMITMERNMDKEHRCGIAKTEISVRILTPDINSAATIPGEVPWMVQIFEKKSQNSYNYQCSGALIHPKVVLTVTHCIIRKQSQNLKVVASGKEIFQQVGVNSTDERDVAKIIKHPNYHSNLLYNDISLLILQNEFSFRNNHLNSVCLPALNQSFDGRRCIATGWEQNKQLKVDVPIVDFQQCQKFLRTNLGRQFNLHHSVICAGGEKGKDTCKGDGGAPLVCLGEEFNFVLTGIVSWGLRANCGIAGEPGMYVNVARFVQWIGEEVRKEGLTIT